MLRNLTLLCSLLFLMATGCVASDGADDDYTRFPDAGTGDDDTTPDPSPDPVDDPEPDPEPDVEPPEECMDAAEPNDNQPYNLGAFADSPPRIETYEEFQLESESAVDLYVLTIVDGNDFNDPDTYVSIDVPEGAEYRLTATALCEAGPDDMSVTCRQDSVKTPDGRGCVSAAGPSTVEELEIELDCPGFTEEGTIEIRVEAVGGVNSCSPYTMTVDVD